MLYYPTDAARLYLHNLEPESPLYPRVFKPHAVIQSNPVVLRFMSAMEADRLRNALAHRAVRNHPITIRCAKTLIRVPNSGLNCSVRFAREHQKLDEALWR